MISKYKYMVYPDGKVHDVVIRGISLTEENVLLMTYYDYTESADMFTTLIKVDGKYMKNPAHKRFDEYTIIGDLNLDKFIEQNLNYDIIGCYTFNKTQKNNELDNQLQPQPQPQPARPIPPSDRNNNKSNTNMDNELDNQLQPQPQPQPARPIPPSDRNNNKSNTNMDNEVELFVVIDGTSSFSETGFVVFEENKSNIKPEFEYTQFTRKQKYNPLVYKALIRANMLETDDVYNMDFNTPKKNTHYVVHCVKCMDKEKFIATKQMIDNESMYVINPKNSEKTPADVSFCNGYLGEYPLKTARMLFYPHSKENTTEPTKK